MTGTGFYTQDFNSLPTSSSATFSQNSTIPGWYAQRTGTGTTIVAGTGSSTTGALYSFGTGTESDRALGSIGSGNAAAGDFAIGVVFQNNTGSTINTITIRFRGEQWRYSGTAAAQTADFSYRISSSAITSVDPGIAAGWTDVNSLDFTSPITSGTTGELDGNDPANSVTRVFTITGLSIPNTQYIALRWSDIDHGGGDHALAIDNFAINWSSTTPLITFETIGPEASDLFEGATQQSLQEIEMVVLSNSGSFNLTSSDIQTDGTYIASDIATNGFKLYYSTDRLLDGTDLPLSSQPATASGSGETVNFSGFSQTLGTGTGYLYTAIDASSAVVVNNTIRALLPLTSSFGFSTTVNAVDFGLSNGGIRTFVTPVTEPTNNPASITLTNITSTNIDYSFPAASPIPSGYLVVRKSGSTFTVGDLPVDGTFYSVSDAIGTSEVIYVGTSAIALASDGVPTPGLDYYYAVVAFNSAGLQVNYKTTPLPGVPPAGVPIANAIAQDDPFININTQGTLGSYTQDFNSLSTSTTWTNNSTLPGWYSNRTVMLSSAGTSNAGGLHNLGSVSTERALGGLTSGAVGTVRFGAQFRNNTGATINHLVVEFDGEQWRSFNSQTLVFAFSTNATDINTGTFTPVTQLNFTGPLTSGGAAVNPPNTQFLRGVISVDIPAGNTIWLRWEKTGSSSPALAIDNLVVTAYGEFSPLTWYAETGAGDLNLASKWTLNSNGSPSSPTSPDPASFTLENTEWQLIDAASYTLSAGLTISGTNSKLVVGNTSTFVIPSGFAYTGTVDVSAGGTLDIATTTLPTLGTLGSTSTVIYRDGVDPIATTYGNLTLDGATTKTLPGAISVDGTLTLSGGIVNTTSTNLLTISETGTIVGGGLTQYIDGPLARATNTTGIYAFPIGDGGRFRNVVVAPNAVTAASYTAEFFGTNANAAGFKVGPEFMYLDQTNTDANNSGGEELANVSSEEYYDISGTEPASIELPWAAETFASGADLGASFANARVAHWVTAAPVGGATPITNGAWVNEGGVSHIGDETAGRVRSGVVTTFSPFAIGSNDPINSLPIELLSFSGERVENGVALAWNTASELNNDRFEIQRALSASFEGYQTIGTVAGSGTTTTETRYTYTDGEAPTTKVYYRLRQVDYDGTATLSRAIEVGGELSWYLDPNPSTSSQLEFGATGADIPATAKVGVQVVGTNGQVLLSQTGAYAEVRALVLNRLTKAAPGQYIVRVTYLGRTFTLRHLRY